MEVKKGGKDSANGKYLLENLIKVLNILHCLNN